MATGKKKPLATPEQFEGATLMRMITKNVKRVRYVDVTFNDTLTLVGGDNEQGKTSYLDSFGFCMGGKDAIQMQPIRNGQQEGSVRCDFGDGKQVQLSVTRTLKRLGDSDFTSEVDVEIPGHVPPTAIESFLKKLTGEYAFDPMELDRMTDLERLEAIQKLVAGFDFKAYALKRDKIFKQRTEVGRDQKREQGAADSIMVKAQPPCELIDESELTRQIQEAGQKNTDRATRASNRQRATEKIAELRAGAGAVAERIETATQKRVEEFGRFEDQEGLRIISIREQIQLLERQIITAQEGIETARVAMRQGITDDIAALNAEAAEQRAKADEIQAKLDEAGELPEEIDTTAISARLDQARESNAQYASWKQLRDRKAEHQKLADEHAEEYATLSKQIDALDAEKQKAVDDAKLPVAGIGFADGYITLEASDGSGPVPWSQASQALRTDTSLELAMAMKPKLKVILIRNGGEIGKRIRQRIRDRAGEQKYRVVLEVIEEGEGTHVIIEDGQVKQRASDSRGAAA